MFKLDTGSGGGEGPWIQWSARGTQDGEIPPKSFYMRTGDGKSLFAGFDRGVVFDIYNLKTGWQKSDGVIGQRPEWKWNADPSSMMAQPGEDYKMGFSVLCAISKTETATWEQAGAAVWNALVGLAADLEAAPGGKYPVIKITGSKLMQFKRGSTVQPILVVDKWIDRPDAFRAGIATAAFAQATTQHQPAQPVAQTAPAMADDTF